MLTVRPLYCPAAGVPSTAQASRMRGRRHAAANHFQHAAASTAQSLLPATGKGPSRRARSRRSVWHVVVLALTLITLRSVRSVLIASAGS